MNDHSPEFSQDSSVFNHIPNLSNLLDINPQPHPQLDAQVRRQLKKFRKNAAHHRNHHHTNHHTTHSNEETKIQIPQESTQVSTNETQSPRQQQNSDSDEPSFPIEHQEEGLCDKINKGWNQVVKCLAYFLVNYYVWPNTIVIIASIVIIYNRVIDPLATLWCLLVVLVVLFILRSSAFRFIQELECLDDRSDTDISITIPSPPIERNSDIIRAEILEQFRRSLRRYQEIQQLTMRFQRLRESAIRLEALGHFLPRNLLNHEIGPNDYDILLSLDDDHSGPLGRLRGVSEEMVGSLPTFIFHPKEKDSQPTPDEENQTPSSTHFNINCCTICIDDFKEGETIKVLPCFHQFHSQCIDQWLLMHSTCPNCKHDLSSEIEEVN